MINPPAQSKRRRPGQKIPCPITAAGITRIDYKDTTLLRQYLTKFNKIVPRYYSGVALKHQKDLARAIKLARHMALLPYVLNHRHELPDTDQMKASAVAQATGAEPMVDVSDIEIDKE